MSLLNRFLDPDQVSLKICGVTRTEDAARLAELGVPALGVNFWPKSKRYLDPADAAWLKPLAERILRVGVFVNQGSELPLQLFNDGLIDLIQLHGDETPDDVAAIRDAGAPFIKAIGVKTRDCLSAATNYGACAILMDAHAPGVYGGTGESFDWKTAVEFKSQHPELPVVLAGGIVPENAKLAADTVHPAALDVASGAEQSPGIKDFEKVMSLLTATRL